MTINWPPVAIGIITYNRPSEFEQTYASLREHLNYPNIVHWVASDDGSPTDYLPRHPDVTRIYHARRGMGYNWNAMIAECESHADLTLCLQDDWMLTGPLDLRAGVSLIMGNLKGREGVPVNVPPYRFVRYHKLTGHVGLAVQIKEWDVSHILPDYCDGPNEYHPEMMTYLDLLAPEMDTFSPYSGGPHLRHKDFTAWYGPYAESAGFSDTEFAYMKRVNAALRERGDSAPRLAMFPEHLKSLWKDIGVSYRGTDVEKETIK